MHYSFRFRFFGNVTVGENVTIDELSSQYDAVVIASGAGALNFTKCCETSFLMFYFFEAGDRELGVPGEDIKGVFSARAFVNWSVTLQVSNKNV